MSIIEKAIKSLSKEKSEKAPRSGGGSSGMASEPESSVHRAGDASHAASAGIDATLSASAAVQARPEPVAAGDGTLMIPFKRLQEVGILTPTAPRSAIAEEFRTIKRPLLVNIVGDSVTPPVHNGKLIMVTSALEGDGKTFCSLSLALSIAMEQDKRVLFVDGDCAKSSAGALLGVPRKTPGLIDLIENRGSHPENFTLDTNMETLRVLPSGKFHPHSNELLASSRMHELILELAEEDPDRVIVFDSPPLLLTTEAAILASFMGQIVFVVSADQTPQYEVTQAIEHLAEDKMVGMVLNRARRGRNPYYYNYGYANTPYGNSPEHMGTDSG